jgi:hypothetical protein
MATVKDLTNEPSRRALRSLAAATKWIATSSRQLLDTPSSSPAPTAHRNVEDERNS